MCSIYDLITLEFINEHDLEHDLEHKSKYTTPKIYDANGDIKQRWYVYFSYRNPQTGKLKRMKNIYGNANKFKTKADRYRILGLYKQRLTKFLRQGYNPFEDNTQLYLQKSKTTQGTNGKTEKVTENKSIPQQDILNQTPQPTLKPKTRLKAEQLHRPTSLELLEAFDYALKLKINVISQSSYEDYRTRIYILHKWLKKHHKKVTHVEHLEKKHILEFLNEVQLSSSPRNRNNYRTVFSTIFQVLEDNEIIQNNFVTSIKPLNSKPKRHKTYTNNEQERIFKYLEDKDPILLLYIKFISYNFLRPIVSTCLQRL